MLKKISMNLSPVVLFVYNRPWHTLQTLEALMQNTLSKESVLYIYADGPKENADAAMLDKIAETRRVIRNNKWCKDVIICEKAENFGLANSVIAGVREVIEKHGKIIVLEDDLVTSSSFLEYMNDGLDSFESQKEISSICAYWDSEVFVEENLNYFVLNGGDCWGWATWKKSWEYFIEDALTIKRRLEAEGKVDVFDYGGMMKMLDGQIENKIDSWHIRWQGSLVLNGQKSIFPRISFINNIGNDGTGTHGNLSNNKMSLLNNYKIKLTESYNEMKTQQAVNEAKVRNQFWLIQNINSKKNGA